MKLLSIDNRVVSRSHFADELGDYEFNRLIGWYDRYDKRRDSSEIMTEKPFFMKENFEDDDSQKIVILNLESSLRPDMLSYFGEGRWQEYRPQGVRAYLSAMDADLMSLLEVLADAHQAEVVVYTTSDQVLKVVLVMDTDTDAPIRNLVNSFLAL